MIDRGFEMAKATALKNIIKGADNGSVQEVETASLQLVAIKRLQGLARNILHELGIEDIEPDQTLITRMDLLPADSKISMDAAKEIADDIFNRPGTGDKLEKQEEWFNRSP